MHVLCKLGIFTGTFLFEACMYNGEIYNAGTNNIPQGDGCNTCTCAVGNRVTCTTNTCGRKTNSIIYI